MAHSTPQSSPARHPSAGVPRALIAGLLLTLVAPSTASAAEPDMQRKITVNGIARLEVPPDRCLVTLRLTVRAKRAKTAVARLNRKHEPLVARLLASGIGTDRIRLGHLRLTTVYGRRDTSHLVQGYDASIALVVELADFDRLAEVMELAAEHGVGGIGTEFRSSRMTDHKKTTRELALAAALDKAGQIAAALNVNVGPVIEVEESQQFNPGRWAMANENVFAAAPGGAEARLTPDSLPLTLTVRVTFGIL